ncbi:hypothetical protein DFJ73DRAFT_847440 [Zopfochytrium polystomum]|nr:hypothetical protein DFJ73DRAFT_847440 [Zopfochytrium polystomum]
MQWGRGGWGRGRAWRLPGGAGGRWPASFWAAAAAATAAAGVLPLAQVVGLPVLQEPSALEAGVAGPSLMVRQCLLLGLQRSLRKRAEAQRPAWCRSLVSNRVRRALPLAVAVAPEGSAAEAAGKWEMAGSARERKEQMQSRQGVQVQAAEGAGFASAEVAVETSCCPIEGRHLVSAIARAAWRKTSRALIPPQGGEQSWVTAWKRFSRSKQQSNTTVWVKGCAKQARGLRQGLASS